MSEQFGKRMSTIGVVFIINGILSFFGLNNYSPYSYFFYFRNIQFFQPKIIWYSLVIISNVVAIFLCIRLRKISKDTNDKAFSRFTLYYFISTLITSLYIIVLLIYMFFPSVYIDDPDTFIKFTAGVGLIYSAISIAVFLTQIIAWAGLYKYSKNVDNEVTKSLIFNFGGIPMLIVIGYVFAIISSGIGAIGSVFILQILEPTIVPPVFATFNAPLLATISSIIWIAINTFSYILLGSRVRNKPTDESGTTYASKQKDIKIAKLSCPNCRNTIYEGQTICSNCGYRI